MISVVIAAYNGHERLKRQLKSILQQSILPYEIVISEAGDYVETEKIVNSFKTDVFIKVVKFLNPIIPRSNSYLVTLNFRNALSYCNGDIIFLADQDDIWNIDKVANMSSLLNRFDLVVGNCTVCDSNLNIISRDYNGSVWNKNNVLLQILRPRVLGSTFCFKRAILDQYPLFLSRVDYPHDLYIFLLYKRFGRVLIDSQPNMRYIRYPDSVSISSVGLIKKITRRVLYFQTFLSIYRGFRK